MSSKEDELYLLDFGPKGDKAVGRHLINFTDKVSSEQANDGVSHLEHLTRIGMN